MISTCIVLAQLATSWAATDLMMTRSHPYTGAATAVASSEYGNKLAILTSDAASSVVELREREHYEYDDFFPGPYSKPSSSDGAPFFASVHWPMRMDKSWAVQFRMKLGARVHESKTPLVSYFQTPENGAAPPGWYLLLEETASARTLSLHVFLNFAAASSAQVVAEWTIGAASAGATTTTTHAIDWVAPISGAASAGGTVTAATGDAVVLNWASGHNVYRADGACPGTLGAFQAAAGYQAIYDPHPGGGSTHDITPAEPGTYCFACISHYTDMHFTLALSSGVLGAAPTEWATALEASEPTPLKLLYTHSGAAKLQSSDFAIELGGVRVAGAATATTDDFSNVAFDRALDLAAVGRLGLGGWDTSLQPAHAQLTTLAHNWPYAGDPLFADIILSERGVDDAWQSTAIDVGPDAASLAMAHTGERFVVGYPAHDRVRVWALNASGWYEFFSTDHYFDAGATDPQVSPGDGYGTTVAMSGNGEVIVVGAPARKRVYTYQAYLYAAEYAKQHSYPDGGHWWENHQTYTEPDYGYVSEDVDGFGTALSLSGSGRTLAIGGPGAD